MVGTVDSPDHDNLTSSVEEPAVEKTDLLDTEAVNQAASDFNGIIPKVKSLIHTMSLNQLRRVVYNLVQFPLGDDYYKFVSNKEDELLMLMLHANGAKEIMKYAVMSDKAMLKNIYDTTVNKVVEEQKNAL